METFKDFKMPIEITKEDGWNGGQWLADRKYIINWIINAKVELIIGGKPVKGYTILKNGVDYDHGHNYNWQAVDIILLLDTPIGLIEKSLWDLMRNGSGFRKKVKMNTDSEINKKAIADLKLKSN